MGGESICLVDSQNPECQLSIASNDCPRDSHYPNSRIFFFPVRFMFFLMEINWRVISRFILFKWIGYQNHQWQWQCYWYYSSWLCFYFCLCMQWIQQTSVRFSSQTGHLITLSFKGIKFHCLLTTLPVSNFTQFSQFRFPFVFIWQFWSA